MHGSTTRAGRVGLLLVSHSAAIADGLAEFVAQVAGPDVVIVAAGGAPGGTLGTDGDKVLDGLRSLSGGAGAVVLMDLGSSVLSVRAALQELLTNVARHGEATHVWVKLGKQDSRLVLEVRDDGRGIAPDAGRGNAAAAGHQRRSLGLVGIRERVEQVGGHFDIHRLEPRGTLARVEVPVPAEG